MNDVMMPYGSKDGHLVHVSTVSSGLACLCTCLSCGLPLVARKGDRNAHHFGHAETSRECPGAWETALHLLSKEAILEGREITLPPVVAIHHWTTRRIAEAMVLNYDEAATEVTMDGLRADAVVGRTGRTPVVLEFTVTHPCGPEKVSRLQGMGAYVVEVDLSGVQRMLGRDEHLRLIRHEAPREWLSHPQRDAVVEGMRRHLDAQAAADEKDRLHRNLAHQDEKVGFLLHAWRLSYTPVHTCVQVPLTSISADMGEHGAFSVRHADWQKWVIDIACGPLCRGKFRTGTLLSHMRRGGLLKEGFTGKEGPGALLDALRRCEPAFTWPGDTVRSYLDTLESEGLVTLEDELWQASSVLMSRAGGRDKSELS